MNQLIISGRLTKEPELRMTESKKKVVSGTLAVARNKDTTDFIDFVAWENNAEKLEKYTGKGGRVILTGELQTRAYEKGDKKIKVTEMFVNKVEIIDFKTVEEKPANYHSQEPTIEYNISDDNLPF